ncbi:hypothetical protein ASE74_17760 [Pedobacter sp. Leaf216]|uniref:hypothetical protein n=1 Tax=Pedobacter sp. Leaf216 TaxID=1735684 RepID=UPI0006F454F3|nr:hypothetical protein [Pedobacter sp. Leaf216]KQM77108.1 hypothetical protein ASE74_17760 [Pedobacter sp. Leaf216]
MLATVKGYYEKGKITLKEKAPVQTKTEVIVTFLTDEQPAILKRIPGALKGKISIPENFNDPLDDLKEYM